METQASEEFSLEVAYLLMEDDTEEDTDESSGAMRSWTNGGIDTDGKLMHFICAGNYLRAFVST